MVKTLPANTGDTGNVGSSLGLEDPREEEMTTRSRILAWKIPRAEKPGWATVYGVTEG